MVTHFCVGVICKQHYDRSNFSHFLSNFKAHIVKLGLSIKMYSNKSKKKEPTMVNVDILFTQCHNFYICGLWLLCTSDFSNSTVFLQIFGGGHFMDGLKSPYGDKTRWEGEGEQMLGLSSDGGGERLILTMYY